MKKQLSLLLAAIMVVGMVPMTAFAKSDNTVKVVKNVAVDAEFDTSIVITDKDNTITPVDKGGKNVIVLDVTLDKAEFKPNTFKLGNGAAIVDDAASITDGSRVQRITAKNYIVTVPFTAAVTDTFTLFFSSTAKEEGEATIYIDGADYGVSSGTQTIAIVSDKSTKTTVSKKTDIPEGGKTIEPIVISEIAAGSLKASGTGTSADNLKLKVSNGFMFTKGTTIELTDTKGVYADATVTVGSKDTDTVELALVKTGSNANTTAKLVITEVEVNIDDAEVGDIAEITVSGSGVSKTTLEVGTYVDYGMGVTVADKKLPVFYSGRYDKDLETLQMKITENIPNSIFDTRKGTITFPEGVKVVSVDFKNSKNAATANVNWNGDTTAVDIKDNVVTLRNYKTADDKKTTIAMIFTLSIAPDFVGDIEAKTGGMFDAATVVVGTAVAPVKVEAKSSDVKIDYRNVAVNDIVITEAFPGALKKNSTFTLQVENMAFESGLSYEVVEGDIKIDEVKTKDSNINITVKSASAKTPAVIKLTGVKLYLNRSLPEGDYALKAVTNEFASLNKQTPAEAVFVEDNAMFQNAVDSKSAAKETPFFNTTSLKLVPNYVKVVTAGRDQDDATFTTKVAVTIGATEMKAGDRTIALDVPAYISATGYTMLPVRAVTEALSGSAIVRWDDATKTVLITFGSRIISMTIGSRTMLINGTAVAMSASAEITNERTFIPLRDLGYALGLGDAKINWDDATKTATLN